MQKAKYVFVISLLLIVIIYSSLSVSGVSIHAATVTSTATATRIRHVTAKPRHTPTPSLPASAAMTLTGVPSPTVGVNSGLGGSIEATVQAYLEQTQTLTGAQALSTTAVATIAPPVRLVIPSLKVDARIESVGKDQNGAMAIPSNVENVAWYSLGTAPGQVGSAVIAGHLDLADGSPAVFWPISALQQEDEVIVYDAANVAFHFRVTGNQRYQYDQAPVEDIFGYSLKSQLNLITCTGVWDRNNHNYSNRLVVYSTLVEIVQPD